MSEAVFRKELGDFSSIICLKALVVGLEEVMGVQGAIEEATGTKLIGEQTGSVLRGQDYDIIDFRQR